MLSQVFKDLEERYSDGSVYPSPRFLVSFEYFLIVEGQANFLMVDAYYYFAVTLASMTT